MGHSALWNLGFRPFYLLASVFSVASVLLWVAQLSGLLDAAYLQGPLWHGTRCCSATRWRWLPAFC